MPLADTRPLSSHTSRVYYASKRREFVKDYPDYADTARVLLALRTDFLRLRFQGASVSQKAHSGGVASITLQLESPERSVIVEIWPTAAGLIADTVIDREWNHWERRGAPVTV